MGAFNHELFGNNGNSGIAYSLARVDGSIFADRDFDKATDILRHNEGTIFVMGAISSTSRGKEGVIKVQPELTPKGREELRAQGLGATALTSPEETVLHY